MKEYRLQKGSNNKGYLITEDGIPMIDPNKYLSALGTRGLSPQTIRAYGYDLVHLFRWLEISGKKFDQINKADLVDYIQYQKELGAQPRSINRRLVVCESYHWYLFDKPIASAKGVNSPAPYYKGPGKAGALGLFNLSKPAKLKLSVKVPKKLIETLTVEEVSTFLEEVTRYRDISIFFMMLMCGLRSCEVLTLKQEAVDLSQSVLRVQGKGNKERIVPIPNKVLDVVKKYLSYERPETSKSPEAFVVLQGKRRGQPMTAAGLRSLFRYRRMKSGIEKARPHRWRHTFGTEMARSGVSYQVLQKIMGHTDGSPITNQYIHLSMSDIADEYERAIKRIQKRYEL